MCAIEPFQSPYVKHFYDTSRLYAIDVGTVFAINRSMSQLFNENLRRVRELTNEMLTLADAGDQSRSDRSCGVLYGILRDMAYRLRTLIDQECEAHKKAGKWD